MHLTTKGRYAVMAMVDLALYGDGKPMALSGVAARQEIALNYLEQIFMKLRKAELVRSVRGPGGGYVLAREKEHITMLDIVQAVDESITMTRCQKSDGTGCMHEKGACLTHRLWADLGAHIDAFLQSTTLAKVCAPHASGLDMLQEVA